MTRTSLRRRPRGAAPATRLVAALAALTAALGACRNGAPLDGGTTTNVQTANMPGDAELEAIPQGPLAGPQVSRLRATVTNPYDGNASALEEGHRLFIRMNCAYCHGFDGGGGMGPNLADNYWRYGGSDADVFKSIYEGRGKGMPAWGAALTKDDIWRLVTYIRSLADSAGQEPQRGQSRSSQSNKAAGSPPGADQGQPHREHEPPLKSTNEPSEP